MTNPYISVGNHGEYITFMCGNCNSSARLKSLSNLGETKTSDLKDMLALRLFVKCPKCNQFQSLILELADVEIE